MTRPKCTKTIENGDRISTKGIHPDRLTKFIDAPATRNYHREIPNAIVRQETIEKSWNNEPCDIRPFYKLERPANVILTADQRQQCIPTAYPSGLQYSQTPILPARPTTSFTAPILTVEDSMNRSAVVEYRPVPQSVFLNEHTDLMNPAQRRERLNFEKMHNKAKKAIRQSEGNQRRLSNLLRAQYTTCNVIGVLDTTEVPCKLRNRGEPYNPNLMSHDMTKRPPERNAFQRKIHQSSPNIDTHSRLFNETPVYWNPERAQHIRNEMSAGRPYDVVSNNVIAYYPPTIPEKQHTRQSHPSIVTQPYTR